MKAVYKKNRSSHQEWEEPINGWNQIPLRRRPQRRKSKMYASLMLIASKMKKEPSTVGVGDRWRSHCTTTNKMGRLDHTLLPPPKRRGVHREKRGPQEGPLLEKQGESGPWDTYDQVSKGTMFAAGGKEKRKGSFGDLFRQRGEMKKKEGRQVISKACKSQGKTGGLRSWEGERRSDYSRSREE